MNEILNLKQFIPSEFCIKCFGCCRFKESDSVWLPLGIEPVEDKDYFVCPNLDIEKNLCKIYTQRPFDCQLYPFLLNRKKDKVFLSMHLNCPYIRENLKKESFKEYINYLKEFSLQNKERLVRFISEYSEEEILNLARLEIWN